MTRTTHRATASTIWALIVALTFTLSGAPPLAVAQTAAPTPAPGNPPAGQQGTGMVDPSQGPLQPVPPEAPVAQSTTPEKPPGSQPPSPAPSPEPLGTAVGQKGVPPGGTASQPAGNALAPAKQHQYRSLWIKIGVVAAGAVAVGTVAALSKGSPSKPPGAK